MKTIELSTHKDLLIFLRDFYETLVYDGSPEVKEYVPKGLWMSLFENEVLAGFINLEPLNNVLWTAHVMLYEIFRGNNSEEWGKLVAEEMRSKYGAKKFIVFTPYVPAKRYAEKIGFVYITTLSKSIKKNGTLMDQYMLELTV